MVHTSDVYPFIKTKLRPKRSGRKNLSSSFVVQNPRYKFKRETFVQSIFMIFFLEIWQIRGLTYTVCCMTLLVCPTRKNLVWDYLQGLHNKREFFFTVNHLKLKFRISLIELKAYVDSKRESQLNYNLTWNK